MFENEIINNIFITISSSIITIILSYIYEDYRTRKIEKKSLSILREELINVFIKANQINPSEINKKIVQYCSERRIKPIYDYYKITQVINEVRLYFESEYGGKKNIRTKIIHNIDYYIKLEGIGNESMFFKFVVSKVNELNRLKLYYKILTLVNVLFIIFLSINGALKYNKLDFQYFGAFALLLGIMFWMNIFILKVITKYIVIKNYTENCLLKY